jgi:thioredoxin reductase (NADPH)
MTIAQSDCLIIGGGPAGLTAATYLARFHLRVTLVNDGKSRALLIPQSHNLPGFPEGISGHDLLLRMREHARQYGAALVDGRVDDIRRTATGFVAQTQDGAWSARAVLLATGVTNRRPSLDDDTHAEALRRGHLRYCPVCDGYEVSGQNVAVIGCDERAVSECEFLRSFSDRITAISTVGDDFPDDLRHRLERIGATIRLGPITALRLSASGLEVAAADGVEIYDAVYPALGSSIHSSLAKMLGAAATEDGCIEVDRHQRTTVKHLYAAGDVVYGLDQISVCNGQAAIAAVAIRNDLGAEQQLTWPPAARQAFLSPEPDVGNS